MYIWKLFFKIWILIDVDLIFSGGRRTDVSKEYYDSF